ncbi:hypothetical protein C7T94_17730 [Pedobacter yulinensis]|uniref:Uncharacterized protein n=1 Tax=Pedobacter yulinensis TaxID=2126353 RepID=A0A2T3HGZ1_9SPHI|nr:hypothetical protein C7T94_17730 [Pedobacter yulinensis]
MCLSAGKQQVKPQNTPYQVSYVRQFFLDDHGKLTEAIDRILVKGPRPADSAVLYTWTGEPSSAESTALKFAVNKNRNEVRINDTRITFLPPQKVRIGKDVYTLTAPYFVFLKKQLLEQRAVADLASLLKDGFSHGDSDFDELAAVTWQPRPRPLQFRILEADLYHKSSQSDHVYRWKAVYYYAPSGKLTGITGDWFNLTLLAETSRHLTYKAEREFDKSSLSSTIWINKRSGSDSSRVTSFQQGLSKEVTYTSYQSVPVNIETRAKPRDLQDAIRILAQAGVRIGGS